MEKDIKEANIIVYQDQFEELKHKYPSSNIESIVNQKINYYRKKPFNSRIKQIFINEIKEFITLYNTDIPEQIIQQGKKELILPIKGKLISEFSKEISNEIKNEESLFFRSDLQEIVEIGKVQDDEESSIYNGFMIIKPNRFITMLEEYVTPGIEDKDRYGDWVFKKKSISGDLANTLLQSNILQSSLPNINRIFTVPLPIIHNGRLTFPKKGYDSRFNSWLPYDSPEIQNPTMDLEEAKKILLGLYKEFCFQTKQDYTNALAGFITPFLRGIFNNFSTRTPVFFYIANRERAGKDYCAGITGIVYEGVATEESPISTSENAKSSNTEELRKKLLAAMINGKKRMHFSNNKGYINNAVFEAVTTAEQYTDRILGKSDTATFQNELDFSLSGNVGVGFTPDLANRCRFIRLFLDIEDANTRSFQSPNLHNEIKEKRGLILSALYSLVRNWFDKGKPNGSQNFSSFPEWAQICGGIMEAAGYDNPANPDKETLSSGGDNETQDMKELFELCYEKRPEDFMKKSDIKYLVQNSDREIFGFIDFDKRADQTKFGNKINRFIGRVLSNIRLVVKDTNVRSARQEFKFTKEKIEENVSDIFKSEVVTLVTNGNLRACHDIHRKSKIYRANRERLPKLPTLPQKNPDFKVKLAKEWKKGENDENE